jgi:hypothetical protein
VCLSDEAAGEAVGLREQAMALKNVDVDVLSQKQYLSRERRSHGQESDAPLVLWNNRDR